MVVKFKKSRIVKGFYIVYDYLTEAEENNLVQNINNQPWVVDYHRRLQYYNYRNELVKPYDLVPIPIKIPLFLEELIDKMMLDRVVVERPDQIIVNEYQPGQGLKPHTDRKDYYKNVIVGVSLASGTIMEFTLDQPPYTKKKIYLPRRSLYIIKDDARYLWKHSIPSRKYDKVNNIIIPRTVRLSITFRNVVPDKVKYGPK